MMEQFCSYTIIICDALGSYFVGCFWSLLILTVASMRMVLKSYFERDAGAHIVDSLFLSLHTSSCCLYLGFINA